MIKTILNIVFLIVTFSTISQTEEFYSLYFSKEDVKGFKQITIPENWYGSYKLKETNENSLRTAAGERLYIDKSGVYIEKNKVLNISREEIRENSKYRISNGYLHGVRIGDSLLTTLDGEYYYFLMPGKEYLIEPSAKLFQISSGKLLFFSKEDQGLFIPTLLNKNNSEIYISDLEYPCKSFDFKLAKDQFIIPGDYKTYVVKPNKQEWIDILKCFGVYDSYSQMP